MMLPKLALVKTIQYSAKENQYLSEVISVEKEGETPEEIFSVDISPQGEGLHCAVNHHTKHGIVYQREMTYPDVTGPFSAKDRESTLSPEFVYLKQLYLSDAWLAADRMRQYRFPLPDTLPTVREVIAMQKQSSISKIVQGLELPEQRNALLDYLREYDFPFELKRERHSTYTENIYVNSPRPETPRYLLCANYAWHKDGCNNAAGLAVLLRTLCLNRSDHLAGMNDFIPPALEFVLLDGSTGKEGAEQYLWHLREEERKQILGVINLEIWEQCNSIVASQTKSLGNGKLFVASAYAAKQHNASLQKQLPSPMEEYFVRESIPFMTISSRLDSQSAKQDLESHLQSAVDFIRDLLRLLSHVQGNEISELPDLAYVQNLPKQQLISLEKKPK